MDVTLLDYGAGNLTSVQRAFVATGARPRVTRDPQDLASAQAIVVPGVGHFGACAGISTSARRAVLDTIARGVPLLGICLGMQWLFDGSDEAPEVCGLGVFAGHCFRLGPPSRTIKVPHVGWNSLERTVRASCLLEGVPAGATGYFTHGYAAPVVEAATAITQHGCAFTSVVERGSIFGVQWHPEKSGRTGLHIVRNFLEAARRTG